MSTIRGAVEDGAWIGARTTVCSDVTVHRNAILTVGSKGHGGEWNISGQSCGENKGEDNQRIALSSHALKCRMPNREGNCTSSNDTTIFS